MFGTEMKSEKRGLKNLILICSLSVQLFGVNIAPNRTIPRSLTIYISPLFPIILHVFLRKKKTIALSKRYGYAKTKAICSGQKTVTKQKNSVSSHSFVIAVAVGIVWAQGPTKGNESVFN
jgi:hypothetical protein